VTQGRREFLKKKRSNDAKGLNIERGNCKKRFAGGNCVMVIWMRALMLLRGMKRCHGRGGRGRG